MTMAAAEREKRRQATSPLLRGRNEVSLFAAVQAYVQFTCGRGSDWTEIARNCDRGYCHKNDVEVVLSRAGLGEGAIELLEMSALEVRTPALVAGLPSLAAISARS